MKPTITFALVGALLAASCCAASAQTYVVVPSQPQVVGDTQLITAQPVTSAMQGWQAAQNARQQQLMMQQQQQQMQQQQEQEDETQQAQQAQISQEEEAGDRRRKLGFIASELYQASPAERPALLAQMAAIDPDMALRYQEEFDKKPGQ